MSKAAGALTPPNDKIKFGGLLSYGLGDFGMTIGWTFLSGYVTFYMTNYIGLSPGIVGTVIMISRLLDAVSDIIVGNAVDRTRSRIGKARPWLIYGALPMIVSFIALFSVPNLSNTGKLLWFIVVYNLASTVCYTIVNIPYGAMSPLMTRDPSSRVNLNVVRMLLGVFSGAIASTLTMPMINTLGGDKKAWVIWAAGISVFMGVCILVCGLLCKERYSGDTAPIPKEKISFKESLKILFGNRYWIIITLIMVISYAIQAVASVNVYYFKYIIGDENLTGVASIAMALPLLIVLFITPVLAKKFNKGTLARFSVVGGIIAPAILLINPSSIMILIIKSVAQGIFMAPFAAVGFAMIADVSDYGYWQSGRKCVGLVGSASSFGIKVGTGIGSGMVGWILAIGGFDANSDTQSNAVLTSIKFIMIGVPIILGILQLIVLSFYKLDKEYPAIMEDIQKREAKESNH